MRLTVLVSVCLLLAGCRAPEAPPIDFDDTVLTADELPAPTVVATATATTAATRTATAIATPTATPVPATATATPTAAATATRIATATATTQATAIAQATATATSTPTPAATPTQTATALPSVTPTAAATALPIGTPPPLPTFGPTPPPVVQALPPGASVLAYQGFWSASPQPEPLGKDWSSADLDWNAQYGTLVYSGRGMMPSVAAPMLVDAAKELVYGHDYLLLARFRVGPNPGTPAFGLTLRDSAHGPAAPTGDSGVWRAGVVGTRAFIIGEAGLHSPTPAEIVADKATAVAPWQPSQPDVLMRFEARGSRYTFSLDNSLTLQVIDDRFAKGAGVGVWADRTQVAVKDFRIYALAQ